MPDKFHFSGAQYYRSNAGRYAGYPMLNSRIRARVCVVGAGFAGLATALGLVERGVDDVVLLEAQTVGHGASGRNGGFIFGGYSLGESQLVQQVGARRAAHLYGLTLSAVELIKHRVRKYKIDCDLKHAGVLLADWFGDRDALLRQRDFMHDKFNVDWKFIDRDKLREQVRTSRYYDGLLEASAAHFQPLKYARGIAARCSAAGVQIFEQSEAVSIQSAGGSHNIITPAGQVQADHVVICGGGYVDGLKAEAAASVLPIATYVMTTEPLGERLHDILRRDWAIYDTRFAFDYYRPLADTRLLWGGRISVRVPNPRRLREILTRDMVRVFPQLQGLKPDHVWSGLMGYPRHKMPMLGFTRHGLWHCIGFGGHGVAPTTAGGELIAAAIASGDKRYLEFSNWPLRSAYGALGSTAAQVSYWYYQLRDSIKDLRMSHRR